MTTILTTLPIVLTDQSDSITSCALELAALVSVLPYPVAHLASIQGKTLRAFGHSINSETQLSVIRLHIARDDRQLHKMCTGWAATADGQSGQIRWKTTNNIQRWKKISKLQPDCCARLS